MAFITHYTGGDGPKVWSMPLILLVLLAISYVTRPPNRRWVTARAQVA